jgi:hypothetical protein
MLSAPEAGSTPMTDHDTPPDHLSNDPRSKFHDPAVLERGIGIRFNGVERHNVDEYCISEGWVRLPVGKSLDRRGQPMTMKVKGKVEAWFLDDAGQDGTPAD